jgi:DNA topoisomerase IA
MKLMIVESPNKIKKIKAILGSGWDAYSGSPGEELGR